MEYRSGLFIQWTSHIGSRDVWVHYSAFQWLFQNYKQQVLIYILFFAYSFVFQCTRRLVAINWINDCSDKILPWSSIVIFTKVPLQNLSHKLNHIEVWHRFNQALRRVCNRNKSVDRCSSVFSRRLNHVKSIFSRTCVLRDNPSFADSVPTYNVYARSSPQKVRKAHLSTDNCQGTGSTFSEREQEMFMQRLHTQSQHPNLPTPIPFHHTPSPKEHDHEPPRHHRLRTAQATFTVLTTNWRPTPRSHNHQILRPTPFAP